MRVSQQATLCMPHMRIVKMLCLLKKQVRSGPEQVGPRGDICKTVNAFLIDFVVATFHMNCGWPNNWR
jgi:hypothetical protein